MDLVMGLFPPLAMADDRLVTAQRAPPWQHPQRENGHTGSLFRFWQCDKEPLGAFEVKAGTCQERSVIFGMVMPQPLFGGNAGAGFGYARRLLEERLEAMGRHLQAARERDV